MSIALRPVHPNAGIEADYRRRLKKMITEMHDSVMYWLEAAYKEQEPRIVVQDSRLGIAASALVEDGGRTSCPPPGSAAIALDEMPTAALRSAIRKLVARWMRNFNEAAPKLAKYFAQSASKRSDANLKQILKDGGFTIPFEPSLAMRNVVNASIAENVALIKSIPSQYFTQIEGMVMRSVMAGRDLGALTKDLKKQFGVTHRRASFIARDQNNKVTSAMNRARQLDLGITEAIWVHSGGGHHPRPTHVKAGAEKTRYDVRKGWFDPHEQAFIFPGQLPNCRCVSKSVIKGYTAS